MVQRCLDTLIPASIPPCRVKTAQGALVQHVSLMICVFLLGCWAFLWRRGGGRAIDGSLPLCMQLMLRY